jgi:Tfp pilus assembly protein PilF
MLRRAFAAGFAIWLSFSSYPAIATSKPTGEGLEDLRDQGYALKQRGDCSQAYDIFLSAAKKSGGAAEDELAAAECAVQLKHKPDAIAEFRAAVARQSELSRDDRIEAITSLADLLEETPAKADAANTWDAALQLSDTAANRLGSARAWREAGDTTKANAMLATVDPAKLSSSDQADYWSEKAEQLQNSDPAAALAAIDHALALEDADYRHVTRADILGKLGRKQEQVAELERARNENPKDAETALALAYADDDIGHHSEAADMFAEAERLGAPTGEFLEDWAYALADAGRTDEADQKFRELIDAEELKAAARESSPESVEAKFLDVRQKVKEIEKNFLFSANFNYRSDAVSLPLIEPQIENGVGGELSWKSPLSILTPRDVSLFGSLFANFSQGVDVNGDSTRAAAGARWTALREPELSFSLERYIKIGSEARDGWAASANFSAEKGTDWNALLSQWFYLTADASVDYLWEEPHSFSAVGEFRAGEAFSLGSYTMLIPHFVMAGEDVNDTGDQGSLLEAGLGLGLRYWLTNDHYRGLGNVFDLAVQYRVPIARDRLGRDGGAVVVEASIEH